MSENDEVPGLEAIRVYRGLWESGLIVGFIVDAKVEYLTILDPQVGWDDVTSGAVPEVIRALGGRIYLEDVETLEDLLEVVNYYKSYTDALSADEGLSKRVNCTEFVIEIYKLYRKVKTKPILGEPRDNYRAREASQELDRYRNRILQMDNSLSAKAELFESIPADERASDETTAVENDEYTFIKEDDFWTIIFEKKILRPIKHEKGLLYIHYLLRNPGTEINAFELSKLSNPVPSTDLSKESTTSGLENEFITSDPFSHAGDAIDSEALEIYRVQHREIIEEINEAKNNNDIGRVEKLLEDKEGLENHLTKSTGLGGRPRKLTDIADRARNTVSKAIHKAMRHLEPKCPELVAYLKGNIHIGFVSTYKPEHDIEWKT